MIQLCSNTSCDQVTVKVKKECKPLCLEETFKPCTRSVFGTTQKMIHKRLLGIFILT